MVARHKNHRRLQRFDFLFEQGHLLARAVVREVPCDHHEIHFRIIDRRHGLVQMPVAHHPRRIRAQIHMGVRQERDMDWFGSRFLRSARAAKRQYQN